jgi:hypothetical protein
MLAASLAHTHMAALSRYEAGIVDHALALPGAGAPPAARGRAHRID